MEVTENVLVSSKPASAAMSFFCMAEAGPILARHIQDRPIYAIPIPLVEPGIDTRLQALAQRAVEKIQAIQASGPYMLGGYSGMGVVAFEVAQQLYGQGQEVTLLAMFDPCPLAPQKTGTFGRFHLHSNKKFYYFRRLLEQWKLLTGLPPRKWLGHIVHRLRCFLAFRFPKLVAAPPQDILAHSIIAYEPGTYAGSISCFVTEKTVTEFTYDPYAGWRELAQGGFEVHYIPGDHYTLWRQPYLGVLVQKLVECLEATSPA